MAEVLSQSQIDALLSAAFSGDMELGTQEEDAPEKKYRKYDFYSPRKFTKDRLKMLNGIFDSYTRMLNSRINGLLHASCEVEVESVEEQRYYEFSNALTEGAVLTLAYLNMKDKIEESPVLLYVSTQVMVSMMDRMMGGEGDVDDLPGDYSFTDLDLRLYEDLMQNFVSIMGGSWESYIPLGFEYGRIEANPTLVQPLGLDETVVIIGIKLKFPNCEGRMSVCLPGMMLTNIFKEIGRENPGKRASSEDQSESIFGQLRDSTLEIVAELGRTHLQLNDIYHLNVGDVIDLNQPRDSMVYLYIGGYCWFDGLMGSHEKSVAVKINNVFHNSEGRGSLQQ